MNKADSCRGQCQKLATVLHEVGLSWLASQCVTLYFDSRGCGYGFRCCGINRFLCLCMSVCFGVAVLFLFVSAVLCIVLCCSVLPSAVAYSLVFWCHFVGIWWSAMCTSHVLVFLFVFPQCYDD